MRRSMISPVKINWLMPAATSSLTERAAMKTKFRIARPIPQDDSPTRHLPVVDLLVDTRTELFDFAVRSGLHVVTAISKRIARLSAGHVMRATRIAARVGPAPLRTRWCLAAGTSRYNARECAPPREKYPCRRFRQRATPLHWPDASSSRYLSAKQRGSTPSVSQRVGTAAPVTRHDQRHRELGRSRHVKRNVKWWRGGQMVLRRVAAGVLEAVEELLTTEGPLRYAQTRGCLSCSCSPDGDRRFSGERCVEYRPGHC